VSTLVVSTYPPERCGVATFTAQAVRSLREQGEDVRILTWGEGKADFQLPTAPRGAGVLQFLRYRKTADRMVFHYMPGFFFGASKLEQLQARLGLIRLFGSVKSLEVMVHEQPWYPPAAELSLPGRVLWNLDRMQWRAARELMFHNANAIEVFRQRYQLSGENARVLPHGCHFRPNFEGDRSDARKALGISPDRLTFASVGFVSERKGYDLAIEALARVPDLDCEYFIVGSAHPASGAADEEYLRRIQTQAANDPRIRFVPDYVDDVAFDCWTLAADVILIPSRAASSSSVLARCRLLGTRAITTRHPGLLEELGPTDCAVSDAAELAAALKASRAGVRISGSPAGV
jgi:glycosyltransferase involved in cell wall biosynthesis